jgi:glycosyltransferase involved in cell wall biosynthesis
VSAPALVIMPCLNCWDYTQAAVHDALRQTLEPTVLVIDNGSTDATRQGLDELMWHHDRLLVWHHEPPLPSLSATWNRALRFAWECGYADALVVNNDVRLHPITYAALRAVREREDAWFVTGVGVTEADFWDRDNPVLDEQDPSWAPPNNGGGPDFSCFCISQRGHETYPFDESFIPAYHEDNDMHRRYTLGGHSEKIFGCGVSFLHWGSRTVNQSDAFMQRFHRKFDQSKRYYEAKWGGPVGSETYEVPFNGGDTNAGDETSARRPHEARHPE